MAHLTCRSPILSCSNYLHTKLLAERSFSKGKTLVSLKQKNTMAGKVIKRLICITFWNFMFVHPYSVGIYGILSHCQFLQLCHKISLIKVAFYVIKVKNIHSWSLSEPWDPWGEVNLSSIHYVIRWGEAELYLYQNWLQWFTVSSPPSALMLQSSCVR